MKNIIITIEGIITMCEYCSWSKYEKYDLHLHDENATDIVFDDECDTVNGWKGLKGIYVQIESNNDSKNYLDEIGDLEIALKDACLQYGFTNCKPNQNCETWEKICDDFIETTDKLWP